jgi:hypothetical protein
VFGIEIDGKRESLRFAKIADAKELKRSLVAEGHKVTMFEYSAAEVEAMRREAADHEFMRLGMQYYIAARAAGVVAGLLPVCGNLYHHSIEMFLKSRLAQTYSLNDLKYKFGHKLPKIWKAFKKEFPASGLSQFDQTIQDVEKYDEIRYPDNVVKRGAQMIVDYRGEIPVHNTTTPQRQEPVYKFYYDDVDRLIGEIFRISSRNPLFYTSGLRPEVREILARNNPIAAALLPPDAGAS